MASKTTLKRNMSACQRSTDVLRASQERILACGPFRSSPPLTPISLPVYIYILETSEMSWFSIPPQNTRVTNKVKKLQINKTYALCFFNASLKYSVKSLLEKLNNPIYNKKSIVFTVRIKLSLFLIKATKVLQSRAESDFEFVFCCLININIFYQI